MGSEEVQSVVVLNPWEFTRKQFVRKPCPVPGFVLRVATPGADSLHEPPDI